MSAELVHEGTLDDVIVVTPSRTYSENGDGEYLGRRATYWCEACQTTKHVGVTENGVPYKGGPSWRWNGSLSLPVFDPSQLMRWYEYPKNGTEAERAEADKLMARKDGRNAMLGHRTFGKACHTYIGMHGAPPGHVIFLGDCSHPLRGVRPLMKRRHWPENFWSKLGLE